MICHILQRSSLGRNLLRDYIKRQALFDFLFCFVYIISAWHRLPSLYPLNYHIAILDNLLLPLSFCQIISTLLRPRNWKAPANRRFFLDSYEVGELCYAAEQIFMHEPTVLQLKAPVKVFGDLHGQFGDLMRLFDEYGFPSTAGDIT